MDLFSVRFKNPRLVRLERVGRTTPERGLRDRSRYSKDMRAPIVGGMEPLSLLPWRNRPSKAERAPISDGMVP